VRTMPGCPAPALMLTAFAGSMARPAGNGGVAWLRPSSDRILEFPKRTSLEVPLT